MTRKFSTLEERDSWIISNSSKYTVTKVYEAECSTEEGEVYFLPAVDADFNWNRS